MLRIRVGIANQDPMNVYIILGEKLERQENVLISLYVQIKEDFKKSDENYKKIQAWREKKKNI